MAPKIVLSDDESTSTGCQTPAVFGSSRASPSTAPTSRQNGRVKDGFDADDQVMMIDETDEDEEEQVVQAG
jgi:hypothetical protein